MAFGSLLGGIITLIGTSPNIIVSRVREEITGEPFGMFDFTPVGAASPLAGVVFLAFGYRLLPRGRKGAASLDAAFNIKDYMTEARVPEESPGRQDSGDLKPRRWRVEVTDHPRALPALRRPPEHHAQGGRHPAAGGRARRAGTGRRRGQAQARRGDEAHASDAPRDEIGVMEAVVDANSALVDRRQRSRASMSAIRSTCSRSAAAASASRGGCARSSSSRAT